jgi:hypothetical protein
MAEELLLSERDLGWIDAHEEPELHRPHVLTLNVSAAPAATRRVHLDALHALADVRTLVVDVGGARGEPLASLLPADADVAAAVRARLRRGEFGFNRGRWRIPSGRCVERLLEAVEQPLGARTL